ncbi:DUF397 domain-containing protein [Streptomyces sp. SID8366]|uniref:DUF397 domain-containing protein n=1 Tax=unclassified Streptomyces TaxID=2593676 RepID=UPI000DBAB3E4|nr:MULTISPECIES: DUF397 domain-containing protein [unclassified Streptomyces]MYU05149.1 DUF397 domain-containing protein [Streptomyces sp. SID8366]MYU62741.1 DUF397 domain-containing protein [Streptomyces sp. SID69]RAJ66026.1 uncharacterized protein DUF397 [Streptomyces sp. PsTaAH-130]
MSAEALQWFKSTYSSDEGGQCLEVAVSWRKSSHSSSEGGQCVEVASCAHSILVRDSKQDPSHAPALRVSPLTWAAFASSVR